MRFKFLALLLLCSTYAFAAPGYFEPWGKDADLKIVNSKTDVHSLTPLESPLGWAAEQAILFHQKVLTKTDGPRSHFRPTSSRYMQLAIQRYGFFKGFIMGCDRLLRENDEKWIYPTVVVEGKTFKWDPP
jgi:hypothetical protein